CCERAVEVGDARMRDLADRLFGGRIDHGEGLAAGRVGPRAVDMELGVWIHRMFLGDRVYGWSVMNRSAREVFPLPSSRAPARGRGDPGRGGLLRRCAPRNDGRGKSF